MQKTLLAAVVLLTGCATGSGIPSPDALNQAMNARYRGQPIAALASSYGIPSEQDVFQGQRYYLWHTENTINWTRRQVVITQGQLGNSTAEPWRNVPYRQTTTARVADPQTYVCTMQVAVDDRDTIKAIGFAGKMGACQSFMP